MIDIKIRRLKKNDGKAVRDISKTIAQKSLEIDYVKLVEAEVKNPLDGSFIAEFRGKVVGYVISYIQTGVFGIEKSAWLSLVGVDPKYMDQGIGKKLANEVIEFYKKKGINTIFTTVRWDSTDLLSYFKTLGFDRSSYINLTKMID